MNSAVIESLDGGKPIRESRDVDIPLAAAHFFYYAGWADKLDTRSRAVAPAARRGRANHPLELSAADGRLEDCTGTGLWQYRGSEAGGNDAADGDEARRGCRDADLPPGVVNIVTGAGESGAAIVEHGTSTRLPLPVPRGRPHDPGEACGQRHAIHAGTRWQGGQRCFADAAIDQAVEGIVNGIFFNQGHVCCAGSRLLVQESVADEVIAETQGPEWKR